MLLGTRLLFLRSRMFCALHYDAVLNIGDAGTQLLDLCKTHHIQK